VLIGDKAMRGISTIHGILPVAAQIALHTHFLDMLEMLIDHGADINAADAQGVTLLHYAIAKCTGGGEAVVLFLHEQGASGDMLNNAGRTI
jgi:ankyrin repeat protein